jgi:hypothetical protein
MKKNISLIFAAILIVSLFLVDCGNSTDKGNKKASEKSVVSTTTQEDKFLFTADEGGSITKIR